MYVDEVCVELDAGWSEDDHVFYVDVVSCTLTKVLESVLEFRFPLKFLLHLQELVLDVPLLL